MIGRLSEVIWPSSQTKELRVRKCLRARFIAGLMSSQAFSPRGVVSSIHRLFIRGLTVAIASKFVIIPNALRNVDAKLLRHEA